MPIVTRATKGSALSHAEMDGNLAELLALIAAKLGIDLATEITATKALPIGADSLFSADSAAGGEVKEILISSLGPAMRDALAALTGADRLAASAIKDLPSGGAALGLWDYWYNLRIGSTATGMPEMFAAGAIGSGTNTNSPPFASGLGYNPYGILLRSSTTPDSGFRLITNNSNDRFGQIGKKFRAQLMWPTAFTDRTVRIGFHNANSVTDATNGAYFEAVGDVVSCKTAENSVRTTDATTFTLSLLTPYTFDLDISADGLTKRLRMYAGTSTTPVLDVTISDSRLTGPTYTTGAGVVATMAGTTASDIVVLYSLGLGTIDGFTRAMG